MGRKQSNAHIQGGLKNNGGRLLPSSSAMFSALRPIDFQMDHAESAAEKKRTAESLRLRRRRQRDAFGSKCKLTNLCFNSTMMIFCVNIKIIHLNKIIFTYLKQSKWLV